MMLIIAVIVIVIAIAILVVQRQKKIRQRMVEEHREMLIKVVDNYHEDGVWLNDNDRVIFRNAIKMGEYDNSSAEALELELEYEEYINWCTR